MVSYTFDPGLIEIVENRNEKDVTFLMKAKSETMRQRLKQVRAYFDENKDYTDAMFYTHNDGTYEAIVRNDMLLPFLLSAFRFRCIESLKWEQESPC
jgi:hypothetical protein